MPGFLLLFCFKYIRGVKGCGGNYPFDKPKLGRPSPPEHGKEGLKSR